MVIVSPWGGHVMMLSPFGLEQVPDAVILGIVFILLWLLL